MALSTNTYIYAGGAQTFLVNFSLGFIQRSDVTVRVNGAVDGSGDPVYSAFSWIDDSNITVTPTLTIGDSVLIERTVSKTELKVSFGVSADITPSNLDLSAKHGLMVYQELVDGRVEGAESPVTAADRSVAAAATSTAQAAAAVVSAAAALVSEGAADAAATQVAADLVATNQDTIDTAADLVLTNADVVLTHADVVLTAADVVATNQDTLDTAADLVATNQDTIDTAADLALTNADVLSTAADVVLTNADVVLTHADVLLTAADVIATADKLPLAGGAMTGPITTNSTFDGVDIATRDGVLTTTTATANAAATLTDVQLFTASQAGEITALTDAASVATDLALSNNYSLTLAGNRTLVNPTNIVGGQSGSLFITQDATGSRTLAFGTYWKFVGGTAPTLSTAAASIDRLDYVVKSSTEIHAVVSLDVK